MIRFRHILPMHERTNREAFTARVAATSEASSYSEVKQEKTSAHSAQTTTTNDAAATASSPSVKKSGKISFHFTALSAVRLSVAFLLFLGVAVARAGTAENSANKEEDQKLPASVDLRPKFTAFGLTPREQGDRPTCSVFTMTGALEFANASAQQHSERLSVEYLNWAANQMRRNQRDGGFFSDMWTGFSKFGICTEEQMPYEAKFDSKKSPDASATSDAKARCALGLQLHWIKRWNVQTGLKDEEFAAIKNTLNQGWPVCAGFRWPSKEHWKKDVLQMCPADAVYDGHSILLVGYRHDPEQPSGGVFIFRNTSHGGRDGYMPFEYAKAYMNDAVWISPAAKSKTDAASASASSKEKAE